jgi:hypothetical protein
MAKRKLRGPGDCVRIPCMSKHLKVRAKLASLCCILSRPVYTCIIRLTRRGFLSLGTSSAH